MEVSTEFPQNPIRGPAARPGDSGKFRWKPGTPPGNLAPHGKQRAAQREEEQEATPQNEGREARRKDCEEKQPQFIVLRRSERRSGAFWAVASARKSAFGILSR